MITKGQQITIPVLKFMDGDGGVTVYEDLPYTVERVYRSGRFHAIGATGHVQKFSCEESLDAQRLRAASDRRRFPERYIAAARGSMASLG